MIASPVNSQATVLVVSEYGTGWWDNGELRLPFGVHVSPRPREIRPATSQEAQAFFRARVPLRRYLTDYYASHTFTGD